MPKFAEKVRRGLLKNEALRIWLTDHQKYFEDLKSAITEDACLKYYDASTTLTLEVDASQKGLGMVLVQNNRPIAFGSKTLTDCRSRCRNIECEMLAIVCGKQQYHTYLYRKSFLVITDHKPLVTIPKPLLAAPPRFQRMLIKTQGCDYEVRYRPGK